VGRTIWQCHIAASLDSKIARPDGSVDDWLAAEYPAEEFGFDAFFAGVDAISMGRGTYEAVLRFGGGDRPYPGKPTTVVSTRPLPDAPPGWRCGRATWPRSPSSLRSGATAAFGSRAAGRSSVR
jgi:dihydrofolate reductase